VTGSVVSPAMRQRVRDLATPVARALGRLGLTPNALTVIGFVGTAFAAYAAANQAWLIAGILIVAFGIFDLFDGTLARATGRVTKFGAFLDSTLDRAGEAVVYVGIAIGCITGGFELGAVLAAAAMGAAFMVSYTRAKSESLGFTPGTGMVNIGLAPREVRIAILAIGLIWTSAWRPFVPLTPCVDLGNNVGACAFAFYANPFGSTAMAATLALITILATITTIQRILHVRAQSREG
jgi:CDP-diacylglycerol--glycerol-3-phosphate 3-phosphatidyltransferase